GWGFQAERPSFELGGGRTTSVIVDITPSEGASFGPHTISVLFGATRATVIVDVKPLGSEPLRAGVGAKVSYALWLDNGTIVASNAPETPRDAIPWVDWRNASEDGATPLWVYVGGQRGVMPPEPYASRGCGQAPCYHPTIPGFDARLQDAGHGQGMLA